MDNKALKNKVIITAAVTGAWPKKENNPNVPMTPQEIADDVYTCWKAGAAVAHLHMRDDEGNGTMDTAKFEETVNLIHTKYPDCDIVLNLTTSGDIHADDEIRVAHVKKLKPEMASYDCGSMNWLNSGLFLNTPKFLTDCGLLFQELGVKPEIEAFDPGMIGNAAYYIKKGVLNGAVALGGNIRVGMEDNVMYAKGQLAESNVQFIERAVRVIKEYGKEVATPDEARQILGLAK